MLDARIVEAVELMQRFAERTGLRTQHARRRYLWTDAFAVCNLLGLGIHLRRDTLCHKGFGLLNPQPPGTGFPAL